MTRSRYFKQAVRHRPVFQWTSDPVEPTKGREDSVHFSSFKLDSMSITNGDFVLVRNTDAPDFAEVSKSISSSTTVLISSSWPG